MQYGLRTLFVVTLLAGIVVGVVMSQVRARQMHAEAIDAITSKGGIIAYDRAEHFSQIQFHPFPNGMWCGQTVPLGSPATVVTFTDGDLPLLDRIGRVHRVSFSGSKVSPTGIEQFRRMHPSCGVSP